MFFIVANYRRTYLIEAVPGLLSSREPALLTVSQLFFEGFKAAGKALTVAVGPYIGFPLLSTSSRAWLTVTCGVKLAFESFPHGNACIAFVPAQFPVTPHFFLCAAMPSESDWDAFNGLSNHQCDVVLWNADGSGDNLVAASPERE